MTELGCEHCCVVEPNMEDKWQLALGGGQHYAVRADSRHPGLEGGSSTGWKGPLAPEEVSRRHCGALGIPGTLISAN